jgi:hypothetical protein
MNSLSENGLFYLAMFYATKELARVATSYIFLQAVKHFVVVF